MGMKAVNIAELKNRLSAYLNEVKRGEEILVRDRNKPVARIIPLNRVETADDNLPALAAAGKVRLGEGILGDDFWKIPAPRLANEVLRKVLEEEREEDRA